MSRFEMGINTVEDVTFLRISGVIDEDNRLAASVRKIEGRTVVLDLTDVLRINSCGVRDWVNWLNDLELRGKQVVLLRCSPAIVNQINLVHNFAGGGVVKSFFAPYYCARCDREELKLLQVEQFAGSSSPKPPDMRGVGCNEVPCKLAFDDIEAAYFAFLPRSGGRVVDERLKKLIEGISPGIKERIKRLDVVEQTGGAAGTPASAQYSPLTTTTSGIGARGRDSVSGTVPPAGAPPPTPRGSVVTPVLAAAALLLAGAIVAYVVLVAQGK